MMSFSAQGILGDQFRANCITCMSPEQIEHLEALLRGKQLSWLEVGDAIRDVVGVAPCPSILNLVTQGQSAHDVTHLMRFFQ